MTRELLQWFDENQRDLPWRKNRSPYRIWVSEIMLQQTQVATVVGYYLRFLKRFPTIKKLAAAKEPEVLKLWEGLGYYRRAKQLHAASQLIVDRHGGKFPTRFEDVLSLPGIGRYTAGAILSIALDQKHPILEGNTIRLFSRLIELDSDLRNSANQKRLWEFSESILPSSRCGDFNQALMELGSEICHPKDPKCLICPISDICPTRIKGLQEKIPVPTRKIKYESIREVVVIVKKSNRLLVRKCAPGERWAGLWDFPRFGVSQEETTQEISDKLKAQTGLNVEIEDCFMSLKHAVTRFRITLRCYHARRTRGRLTKPRSEMYWAPLEEIDALPMSVTGRKIAKRLISDSK